MTAVAPTVTGMSGNASIGFSQIGGWLTIRGGARQHPHRATGGGYRAGEGGGKLGLFLHCQDTALIEDNLDLVDAYHAVGLRVVQLCYNRKNLVGDGASERTDAGLSDFGANFAQAPEPLAHGGGLRPYRPGDHL